MTQLYCRQKLHCFCSKLNGISNKTGDLYLPITPISVASLEVKGQGTTFKYGNVSFSLAKMLPIWSLILPHFRHSSMTRLVPIDSFDFLVPYEINMFTRAYSLWKTENLAKDNGAHEECKRLIEVNGHVFVATTALFNIRKATQWVLATLLQSFIWKDSD